MVLILMIYRCKGCHTNHVVRILPTATCGVTLLAHGSAASCVTILGCDDVAAIHTPWAWLASPVVWILTFTAIHYTLALAEFGFAHVFKCSACGACRWSWGFTEGFGL